MAALSRANRGVSCTFLFKIIEPGLVQAGPVQATRPMQGSSSHHVEVCNTLTGCCNIEVIDLLTNGVTIELDCNAVVWLQMVEERSQLPIADSHDEILDAIEKNQVVLIRGETGSGKTTQVCAMYGTIYGLIPNNQSWG